MRNMKTIDLNELKKVELAVLKQVRDVCNSHGLRYYLAAGTLLGAVRHGGFIPWDDDIDICMPRPDYDKLIEICKKEKMLFDICCVSTMPKYSYAFAKAYAPNTIIKEKTANRDNIEFGVYIDIFPLDGYGNTIEESTRTFKKIHFKLELLIASNWKKFSRSKTHSWYYEPFRFVFFVISRIINTKGIIEKLERDARKKDFDSCNYVSTLMSSYRAKGIMPREYFAKAVDLEFEGEMFSVPIQYDKYLKHCYGDYMKLPPEKNRVTHHDFEAYYID